MTTEAITLQSEIVPLREAGDESRFGAKSANLARALSYDMPVPDGFALSADAVDAINGGYIPALRRIHSLYEGFAGLAAVRSSAIGEDSQGASFAGQHNTVLGVLGEIDLLSAIMNVYASGHLDTVTHYRQTMGVEASAPQTGITVQHLVNPNFSGVLFTRNPVDGSDSRIAEAAWGLGEVVVASLVTPDHIEFRRGGKIVDKRPGHKSLSIHPLEGGGTYQRQIEETRAKVFCLEDDHIQQLDDLAEKCEERFGGPQDIEWAFEDGRLYLLQTRPITTINTGSS